MAGSGKISTDVGKEIFFPEKTSAPIDLPVSKNIDLTNTDDNEVGSIIENNLEQMEGGYFRCKICGKDSKGMTNSNRGQIRWSMKNHIETHIDGISFPCQLCGKQFRSKNSFAVHKSKVHKNK